MESMRIRLGQRVRQLRQEKEWSQEMLAEKAGLHRTYIGAIEHGRHNVSLDNVVKIAGAFGVSPIEFLDLNEPGSKRRRELEASIRLLLKERRTEDLAFIRSLLRLLSRFRFHPGN